MKHITSIIFYKLLFFVTIKAGKNFLNLDFLFKIYDNTVRDFADLGEKCSTSDGSDGRCQLLAKCDALDRMIKNPTSRTEAIKILNKSNCGYVAKSRLVCCSSVESAKPAAGQFDAGPQLDFSLSINVRPSINKKSSQSPVVPKIPNFLDNNVIFDATKGVKKVTPKPKVQAQVSKSTVAPSLRVTMLPSKSKFNLKTQMIVAIPPSPPKFATEVKATSTSAPLLTSAPNLDASNYVLSQDCGRVLTNRYFRGNLTELGDFPWMALLEYTNRKLDQSHCKVTKFDTHTFCSCSEG